jgi:hypothetical protein
LLAVSRSICSRAPTSTDSELTRVQPVGGGVCGGPERATQIEASKPGVGVRIASRWAATPGEASMITPTPSLLSWAPS